MNTIQQLIRDTNNYYYDAEEQKLVKQNKAGVITIEDNEMNLTFFAKDETEFADYAVKLLHGV